MPGSQRHDDAPPSSPPRHSPLTTLPVTGDRPKRWMKQYRTEVAASVSSVLSTFVAYPLDSVKTRMQAYVPLEEICTSALETDGR
ncbi:MAG: hypothetical protein M1817_006129 [Caeruleum heppii]|nr:MAG: hypothetical protein M1817_006129 [Caeruleum heppii]